MSGYRGYKARTQYAVVDVSLSKRGKVRKWLAWECKQWL